MKLTVHRNLAILCAMVLTTSVVVGLSGISQAAPHADCQVVSLSADPTPAGDPLLLAGTHISFGTTCVGNTQQLPAGITVKDPAGNLIAKIASALEGTGNLSNSQNIYIPVQGGYEVCVEVPGDVQCVKA